ncbi:hypothetical protein Y032_0936g3112, partial [Ancylostoma ceylanicum]
KSTAIVYCRHFYQSHAEYIIFAYSRIAILHSFSGIDRNIGCLLYSPHYDCVHNSIVAIRRRQPKRCTQRVHCLPGCHWVDYIVVGS